MVSYSTIYYFAPLLLGNFLGGNLMVCCWLHAVFIIKSPASSCQAKEDGSNQPFLILFHLFPNGMHFLTSFHMYLTSYRLA